MTNKYHLLYIIPLLIVIALMVVGTLYDLQISLAVYDRNSLFGKIFDYAGELPLYILFPFTLGICFVYFRQFKGARYLVLSFLSVILSVLAIYLFMQKFFGDLNIVIMLAITLIICVLLLYGLHFIKYETLEKLYKFAIIALIVMCVCLLLNQAIKYLWGRYRFHNIFVADNLERFTAWYQPQGINGNKSFPSGHASSATNILLLVTLFNILGTKKWLKIVTTILCSLYIGLVCYSRIVLGAHYLTDVTMGFAISFLILIIVTNLLRKNKRFNY